MTATHAPGGSAPWTLADVAKSLVLIALVTVLVLAGAVLLRFVVPVEDIGLLVLMAALVAELSMLLAVWLFAIRKYQVSWSALGFRPFDPVRAVTIVSVVLIVSFAVNVAYVQVIGFLNVEALRPPPVLPQFLTGIWRLIVPLVLASGVAPVVEEAFFRGFVFSALERQFGFWLAASGSALLFTLAHLQLSVLVPIFILGVLLAWLYERTQSLWPCVALHFVYNSLALLAAFTMEVSGPAV